MGAGTSPTLEGLRETGTVTPRDADHSDKRKTVAKPRFMPEWEGFLRSKNTSCSSFASYNDAHSEKSFNDIILCQFKRAGYPPIADDKACEFLT